MEQKFYICRKCKKMMAVVKETGCAVSCCGGEMKELIPGTTEAAAEKHIPVYEVADGKVNVTVGSVEHPMLPEHYIEWISIQTKLGNQRQELQPGQAPKAVFPLLDGDEVQAVLAYCNLHSLWQG